MQEQPILRSSLGSLEWRGPLSLGAEPAPLHAEPCYTSCEHWYEIVRIHRSSNVHCFQDVPLRREKIGGHGALHESLPAGVLTNPLELFHFRFGLFLSAVIVQGEEAGHIILRQ